MTNKYNKVAYSGFKLKVQIKGSQVTVKRKLSKLEEINQEEFDVFQKRSIRGLMKPKSAGNRKIEYIAPGNMRLSEFIRSGITQKDFYIIFANLVECLKKVEWHAFNPHNLVLDLDYIFYNPVTKEVQFLYQPVHQRGNHNNIFILLYELAESAVFSTRDGNEFASSFVYEMRKCKKLSSAVLETYILKHYPQVYKQVKRFKPGESQSLANQDQNYFERKYNETAGEASRRKKEDPYANGADSIARDIRRNDPEEDTYLSSEEGTGIMFEDKDTDRLLEEEEENTGLLGEGAEETSVLLSNEGTGLVEDTSPASGYLIRQNIFEKVKINKTRFLVGKERDRVDYCVSNNNAVSRLHAVITVDKKHYYIKDNNSTNHTFINGMMIETNERVEIHDGDAIMLGNEPFEFRIC